MGGVCVRQRDDAGVNALFSPTGNPIWKSVLINALVIIDGATPRVVGHSEPMALLT